MSDYPFVPARWFHQGRQGKPVLWLVVHTPETLEAPDSAEGVAGYFAHGCPYRKPDGTTGYRKASAHVTIDSDSVVRSVRDEDTAFAAAGANNQGLHAELAGRAAQTPGQWADAYSVAVLHRAAAVFARWARERDIPVRFVDAAGLKKGEKGITTHAEVSKAWPSTGHSDPGTGFPMQAFLALIRTHLTGAPTTPQEDDMPPIPFKNPNGSADVLWFPSIGRLAVVENPETLELLRRTSAVTADGGRLTEAQWKGLNRISRENGGWFEGGPIA